MNKYTYFAKHTSNEISTKNLTKPISEKAYFNIVAVIVTKMFGNAGLAT